MSGSMSAVDVLIKILNEMCIKGSTKGYIVGETPVVCFQDTPLYGISQNIYHESVYRDELGSKVRYSPTGLSFNKLDIYRCGGRPCIYEQKDVAKKFLPPEEWWRIVNFNLNSNDNIVDWTHEREWRIKGDLVFPYYSATIILSHNDEYREFIGKINRDVLVQLAGVVVLSRAL
ncbi:DUF2971 domain-containing protein [Paenibacillus sp. FSL R7-0198]|uniref:DUF2971 domain-containing protein n=1 Tax=Paenibacillus sp. FSL R7-0198 TaxID=2921674 RepID=UPI0030F7783B